VIGAGADDLCTDGSGSRSIAGAAQWHGAAGAYAGQYPSGSAAADYFSHVLTHIAAADTVEKIEALLPWNAHLSTPSD
jgi:hypothetical protein